MISDQRYINAVRGRQDFRAALRHERILAKRLRSLLCQSRESIPQWTTGVNDKLLKQIDEILSETR